MEQFIKILLCIWATVGYFVLCVLPKPKNRKSAIIILIVGGPIAWITFIPISIIGFIKGEYKKYSKP